MGGAITSRGNLAMRTSLVLAVLVPLALTACGKADEKPAGNASADTAATAAPAVADAGAPPAK